ncbi:MAG: hypothetical protein ACRCWW_21190, partial [Scandinavium sp.]
MASSYDVINLSDLAVPDAIIVPDADDIFSAWLTRLRELDPDFDALVESDPTLYYPPRAERAGQFFLPAVRTPYLTLDSQICGVDNSRRTALLHM